MWMTAGVPALFVFIWSTGYIVAKYAVPHAEPLTFLSLRYVGVIVLMGVLAVGWRAVWPTRRQAVHLAIAGVGIQACYLGGVWVAVAQGMPAGTSALIVNLQPVLTAAFGVWLGDKVSGRHWLGIALGLLGVGLVVVHKLGAALPPGAVLLCVAALLGITLGTLYQKRFVPNFDLRTGQVIQFVASLAVTLPLAWQFESLQVRWTAPLLGALAWSVLVLTAGGISLMFYMLRRGSATAVTSVFYLVPGVTALMAWALFDEPLTRLTLLGISLTLVGVLLVTRRSPYLPANLPTKAAKSPKPP
jgi:drug/metabolite transporter (DMT)-like permease